MPLALAALVATAIALPSNMDEEQRSLTAMGMKESDQANLNWQARHDNHGYMNETLDPKVNAASITASNCVKVITGSQRYAEGTLNVNVYFLAARPTLAAVRGAGKHAQRSVVFSECYEESISHVRVSNPTTNAWNGQVLFSQDSGVSFKPMRCTSGCMVDVRTACSNWDVPASSDITVDGNYDGISMSADASCLGGGWCTLMAPDPPPPSAPPPPSPPPPSPPPARPPPWWTTAPSEVSGDWTCFSDGDAAWVGQTAPRIGVAYNKTEAECRAMCIAGQTDTWQCPVGVDYCGPSHNGYNGNYLDERARCGCSVARTAGGPVEDFPPLYTASLNMTTGAWDADEFTPTCNGYHYNPNGSLLFNSPPYYSFPASMCTMTQWGMSSQLTDGLPYTLNLYDKMFDGRYDEPPPSGMKMCILTSALP
jgi:hypothetical protein